MVTLANYELIPAEEIADTIYKYPLDDEPISSIYSDFGYERLSLFSNLGIILFYTTILLGVMLITLLLGFLAKRSKIINIAYTFL